MYYYVQGNIWVITFKADNYESLNALPLKITINFMFCESSATSILTL